MGKEKKELCSIEETL